MKYIMIPRELIFDTNVETDEDNIKKVKGNNRRVMLFSYFANKRSFDDTIGFTCDEIVKWCGYKPNYNIGKVNEEITQSINTMIDNDYLSIPKENNKELYSIYRKNFTMLNINTEKFTSPEHFALIYLDELEKVRNFKNVIKENGAGKISSSILLLVLSYIRVNMLRRKRKANGNYTGNPSDKPEFCYRMYIDIRDDIGISSRYISMAIKILVELDLIVSEQLPRYKDTKGNWHTSVTIFVDKYRRSGKDNSLDETYDYEQEIQWGKEYIRGKKYLNKKFDQDTN